MFELTISTRLDKQSYISKLYKSLIDEIKSVSGVAIKQNFKGRSYFSLAVKSEDKDYFKAKILDFIVYMIVDDYKYNYFKDNLENLQENIVFESFLKAVCIFDEDIDREYILKQINFKEEILVDSFYYFKLQMLRDRWQKTVGIIKFNQIINSKNSMLEVLKYLVAMSECLVQKAEVFISKKQVKLRLVQKTSRFQNDSQGLSKFLSEIIELNPAKIEILRTDDYECEVVDVLNKIFYDKINF